MINRRAFIAGASFGLLPAGRGSASTKTQWNAQVVTGFRGVLPGDPEVDTVRRLLEMGEVAGVILLRRNVVSPEQLIRLSMSLREAAGSVVPIISIDQEGGAVARLDRENGFSEWLSASEVAFRFTSEQEVYDYYFHRAIELSGVGINVNFGPVLDLNLNPLNPIIGRLDRSFGSDPANVFRCAAAFVRAHRSAGVMTCGKHFPGHGSSTTDSHAGPADINDTWIEGELLPFRAMTDAGLLDAVMTAHLLHQSFSDSEGIPSSLSRTTLDRLRQDIDFDGPVFTDDMQMQAISDQFTEAEAAIAAIAAGNTFLVYANHASAHDIGTAQRINKAFAEAVTGGSISEAILQEREKRASAFVDQLQ